MNDLERFLTALWQPGDVREVRSPQWDGRSTASGYFDDPDKLVAAVKELDGRANLYITLNPVKPALLARAANRINRRSKTTTADPDILERRWIFVDIDPVRPSGISSTEAESAAALHAARAITQYLTELGWPLPLVAMTGNGYALLIPIQLPNQADSTALVAGFLAHLAERFSSEEVSVDTTVSNAARIVALIGTMKVKGDSTTERPHRRATLIWVPEKFEPISAEQLRALKPPQATPVVTSAATSTEAGWVKAALERAKISFRELPTDAMGIVWYGLEQCPYHPDDGTPWQCGVGERPDGAATGKCFHNRGTGRGWQDFKHDLGLETGGGITLRLPKGKPEQNGISLGPGMDAADLLELDLPPLRWIVPDLLPEGTTILAAPPKVGKSCLIYQIAVEASVGGTLLDRRVEPGSVLYLALEDGKRRGQERLRAALAGRTMPRGRLEIRWSAPRIGEGLEESISEWLDTHPDAELVAIDTLGKVRPHGDSRRNAYDVDVGDMARLQDLFRNRSVALVIVHHARKEGSDDFLTAVSGTYGITGSADTIAMVRRKRLEAFGTIAITGRDVPDAEISVRFDGMTWHEAPQVVTAARAERQEVYEVIASRGPIFPADIAKELGDPGRRKSIDNMCQKMQAEGAIARTTGGWTVPKVALTGTSPTPVFTPPGSLYGSSSLSGSESQSRNAEDTHARAASDGPNEGAIDESHRGAIDAGERFLRIVESGGST